AMRRGWPVRQPSPKKSPFSWRATTASLPFSETTVTLHSPSLLSKTASAESPWRKIVSFFRYFALVLPPSAWDRKDSRTKGCFLLIFTGKVPRLIRAASESDCILSAIPPPESVQAGFRHLNVEPGAVGLQ